MKYTFSIFIRRGCILNSSCNETCGTPTRVFSDVTRHIYELHISLVFHYSYVWPARGCNTSHTSQRSAHARILRASDAPQNYWLPFWHDQITVYTDMNKTSIDINKHTEQRLTILHSPAVNQLVRQKKKKVKPQVLPHFEILAAPNNRVYIYF
jgi:hypothetical protein